MASGARAILSASTQGQPVTVGTSVTALHTAAGTATYDELWVWAYNSGTSASVLTYYHGGTAAALQSQVSVPQTAGWFLVIPGLTLTGTSVASVSSTSTALTVSGHVNRAF